MRGCGPNVARVVPEWVRRAKQGTSPSAKGVRPGFRHGFRSGLEETLGAQIEAATGEPPVFETFKLPYMVPEKRHLYTPDFKLTNGILVEAKGIFDATDRAKHLLVKAQYPALDIRFVFYNQNAKIAPGSKTTLAEWAAKYGYKFAHKRIPAEWFTEAGPAEDPLVVIGRGPYGYAHK